MALCSVCNQPAGMLMKICASCQAKQAEIEARNKAANAAQHEAERKELIDDEKARVEAEIAGGGNFYLHRTEFIPVDSILSEVDVQLGPYDDTAVRIAGLEGWRVVGVVPKTFGTALINNEGFNKVWGGGVGGAIVGTYILMELEVTSKNFARLQSEINEYIETVIQ